MSEYSFTYRNDNFSLEKAGDATLFIKAGKTAISFLIAQNGQLLAWKDNCPLEGLADDTELNAVLNAPYKKVVTGLTADALTLIPSALYATERIGDYARFLDVKAGEKVFTSKLDDTNQVIYKTAATDALAARFSVENTIPADRGWINAIAQNEPSNYALYIDIFDGQISVVSFNSGQVRFYNCFKTESIDDILYYSLFVAEQLDLKPDYTSLVLSGNTAAGDIDKLSAFFRLVKYNDLKLLEAPYGVPLHQSLSLSALV